MLTGSEVGLAQDLAAEDAGVVGAGGRQAEDDQDVLDLLRGALAADGDGEVLARGEVLGRVDAVEEGVGGGQRGGEEAGDEGDLGEHRD